MKFKTKDLVRFKTTLPKFGVVEFQGVVCEPLEDGRYIIKTIEPGFTDKDEKSTMAAVYSSQMSLIEENHKAVEKNTKIGPFYYDWASER